MVDIKKFLELELKLDANQPVVVAVSGGPDSMALVFLLEQYCHNIICVHVNHNTGRNGQDEDEQFVRNYCQKHNHIFESIKIKEYDNSNFHDQAHKMRYEFFEQMLKKHQSKYLFTAHHGDDLVETMIFRMIRGSTIKSLFGLSKITNRGLYTMVRPLLEYTKEQLLEYNKINHIEYQIDSSNITEVYTRNRIRKYLISYMKQENPNFHLNFLHLSEELKEMESYLNQKVYEEVYNRFHNFTLQVQNWKKLDHIIQKRILQVILQQIYHDCMSVLESCHVRILNDFILTSQSGSNLHFPKGIRIRKEYENIIFIIHIVQKGYEFELSSNLKLPNGHEIKILEKEETDSNFVCRLNLEEIEMPLIVRTRQKGDCMSIKGLSVNKKIKDIFINSKVPIHLRQDWPIVADKNGKIVWLPGLKKSHFDKTKEEKYDIILRYY